MKINLVNITFSLIGLFITSHSHAEISFEQELKQGCTKLSEYKLLGQKFYNQKNYKKALEQFQEQAAWTPFCQANGEDIRLKISDKEVDIANNNVGLTYAKLGKPLWAKMWFQINPSKTSQFNLRLLPKPKQDHDFSGKYVRFAGFGQWNSIYVSKKKNQYHIEFSGVWMGLRSLVYGPNIGQFETTMPINKKIAKTQECNISLKFGFDLKSGNYISAHQPENPDGCGYFGMNVSADGLYQKVEE